MFSFLPGNVIFHKIAVLNRNLREELPKSGLLDQEIELSLKVNSLRNGNRPPQTNDLVYGLNLATVINFDSLVNNQNGEYVLAPRNVLA